MTTAYDPQRPGGVDVNLNDAVAFFVELIALAILGIWAWRLFPDHLGARTVSVVVVVGAVATLWGLLAAPKARVQSLPAALTVKAVVLGGSIAAAHVLWSNLAITLTWVVIVVVNTALTYVGPYARRRPGPPPPAAVD